MTHFRPAGGRWLHRREAAIIGATLLSICLLHLVRPDRVTHQHAARVAGLVTYTFNVDSAKFAYLVVTFPGGFQTEEGKIRQMRPLYPALGWIVYQCLRPFGRILPSSLVSQAGRLVLENEDPTTWGQISPRDLVLAWGALILVNLALLGTALCLGFVCWMQVFPRPTALLVALVPAFHLNAIDFALVPHTEAFNILIPGIALAAMQTWMRGSSGWPWSFGFGLAQLGKGIPFPAVNWLDTVLHQGTPRRKIVRVLLVLLCIAGPVAAYLVLLRSQGITLYNHEIAQYRQGVWILDAIRQAQWMEIPRRLFTGLISHLYLTARGFLPLVLAVGVLFLLPGRNPSWRGDFLGRQLVIYFIACALFWSVLGFHQLRLTVTQYPLIAFLTGSLLQSKTQNPRFWLTILLLLQILLFLLGWVH